MNFQFRIICLVIFMTRFIPIVFAQGVKVIPIETRQSSLIYTVSDKGQILFCYYGKRIEDKNQFTSRKYYNKADTNRDLSYEAYPTNGIGNMNEPAFCAILPNGSLITEFKYAGDSLYSDQSGKYHSVIYLKDIVSDLKVELHTESYYSEDVIAQWTVIINQGKRPVRLVNFYSSYLNLNAGAYHLTHFNGSWAGEMNLNEEKLNPGIKTIESKKGVRTTQTENPSFILSLNHPRQENHGECYGGALAWSGNYKLSFELDEWNHMNILGGINPFLSSYNLDPEKRLATPKMIYTYSDQGAGQVSRNFHNWSRKWALWNAEQPRPVVLNSWEGAYFSFNETIITRMMDEAAGMGIELFVLDDGWFGNKYPRNSDDAGLGDWQTNQNKLPRGLEYLINHALSKGLMFGIWIEPEMVNPKSELAVKHPDWIVQSPGREQTTLRNQLLLDLSNPAVQHFVWHTIDSLLTNHPKISYLKWDANRHVEQAGSTYLPQNEQSHFWINYTIGLYSIYQKIREKYPKLVMQVCASGGGRMDYGSLAYHQEFWTSDNTDPLKRLYIQYCTNLIYPPVATASHVSTSPNHQTGRITPLKFRFDVAMSGRLGLELQPRFLSEEERDLTRTSIANYKKYIRPVITEGDLYRILSPYDGNNWASQLYISKDQSKAVLFAFSTADHARNVYPTLKLKGLDPKKKYRITELNPSGGSTFWGNNQVFTGEFLMHAGVELNIARPYDSALFLLIEE